MPRCRKAARTGEGVRGWTRGPEREGRSEESGDWRPEEPSGQSARGPVAGQDGGGDRPKTKLEEEDPGPLGDAWRWRRTRRDGVLSRQFPSLPSRARLSPKTPVIRQKPPDQTSSGHGGVSRCVVALTVTAPGPRAARSHSDLPSPACG